MRHKQPHPLIAPLASPKASGLAMVLQDDKAKGHANTFRQKPEHCGLEAKPSIGRKVDEVPKVKMPTIAQRASPVTFGKQQASIFCGFGQNGCVGKLLESQHQRMCPFFAVTVGFQGNIKLVNQSQPRKAQIHRRRFLQRDFHVLNKVLDEKARVKVPLEYPRSKVVKGPASSSALADGLEHGLQVQACFVSVK
jgi:hypothetical protein